jgi:hypothetical protein
MNVGDRRSFEAALGVLPDTVTATLSCLVLERAELVIGWLDYHDREECELGRLYYARCHASAIAAYSGLELQRSLL